MPSFLLAGCDSSSDPLSDRMNDGSTITADSGAAHVIPSGSDSAVLDASLTCDLDAASIVSSDTDTAAYDAVVDAGPPVSYRRDVAPIFARHCVHCHRPNGEGPFDLTNYASAFEFGREAVAAALGRVMPPCVEEDPRCGPDESELATLLAWLQQGRPEGS